MKSSFAIFGLGYVGAVTAGCLAARGHPVCGVDVHPGKVAALAEGRSPIVEPGLEELIAAAVGDGRLRATTDAGEAVAGASVLMVCVGTPSLASGRLNLDHVRAVCAGIAEALTKHPHAGGPRLLVLRSTMLPGSTESLVREFFAGLIAEGALEVVVCPEFLREGTAVRDFAEPSLAVVGTGDGAAPRLLAQVTAVTVVEPRVMKWAAAEMIKYSCNYFHAVKVAFANEIGRLSRHLGVDGREVMAAVCADRRLNISEYYLRPGNPFGGSCLPKDVSALSALARQEGVPLPLLESVLPTNQAHLDALLAQIEAHRPRRVAILGLTFKADTDDLRGSPMVAVAETLSGRGVEIAIHDPWIDPDTLTGANERDIRQRMPHLGRLLAAGVADAVRGADVVLVAQRCTGLEHLGAALDRSQVVIDVNGWPGLDALTEHYEGSCW